MNDEKELKQKLLEAQIVVERALTPLKPKPSWLEFLGAVEVFQANPQEVTSKAYLMTFAQFKGRLLLDESEWKPEDKTPEEILIDKAKQTIKEQYKDHVIFTKLFVFEKGVRGIVITPVVVEIGQDTKKNESDHDSAFLRFTYGDHGFLISFGLEELQKALAK